MLHFCRMLQYVIRSSSQRDKHYRIKHMGDKNENHVSFFCDLYAKMRASGCSIHDKDTSLNKMCQETLTTYEISAIKKNVFFFFTADHTLFNCSQHSKSHFRFKSEKATFFNLITKFKIMIWRLSGINAMKYRLSSCFMQYI